MKKKIFSLILTGIMSLSLAFSSCQYILPKSVVNASLNEKGELILTYSDNTTQNVGMVKGEDGKDGVDGKDGQDGKDLTASCEHTYGDWKIGLNPSCTSIGFNKRVCSLCGDLDYQFTNPLGHNYGDPKDVVNIPGEEYLVNKTCSICGDTKIVDRQNEGVHEHSYNNNGVCLCGEITHFIESDEYIEVYEPLPDPDTGLLPIIWWSVDKSYGLVMRASWFTKEDDWRSEARYYFSEFVGTPINVKLPESFQKVSLKQIGTEAAGAFGGVETIKSVIIPKSVTHIYPSSFKNCISLTSVFLEGAPTIEQEAFCGCNNVTIYHYSESQPMESGNYWHYVDKKIVKWENSFCEHTYGEWKTVSKASCLPGQNQRVCIKCEYVETEETPALKDFFAHSFNEKTLCTTCGYQEFIESVEYIEFGLEDIAPVYVWWNRNKSYALTIMMAESYNFNETFIFGYRGEPVNVVIPTSLFGISIMQVGGFFGWGSYTETFSNCKTLKSVVIPKGIVRIYDYTFNNCAALEKIKISETVTSMDLTFTNSPSMKEVYVNKESKLKIDPLILPQGIEIKYYD